MSNEKQGREAAAKFRHDHHLGTAPIDDMVALLDLLDVDVLFVDAGSNEHGLTARDSTTGTMVIVVNANLSPARLRSTLAHEMGHLLFPDDLNSSPHHEYTSASETRAHAFARHLLLPLDAVKAAKRELPHLDAEGLLNWCVKRYAVSPAIAAIQLKTAHLIDSATCEAFKPLATKDLAWKYGWRDLEKQREAVVREGPRPRRLQELATRAYLAGAMPITELAVITGHNVDELLAELPPPPPVAQPTNDRDALRDDDLSDLP